ncbi:putative secreted protein [Saccharothrix espanaensis DSM 44229]|uniref:Putative secreted protein n=1 Tax=Saccharothrix espanaensis (strain ATCC 51144 / DSM 44229 / JCM 9112 / NBRC 15066 / NRRL 15764) TaxID=1179773 RepID=K0JT29_SACES|nr:putative secreted protein [Saccharothrix espanaensis DSM 44229]
MGRARRLGAVFASLVVVAASAVVAVTAATAAPQVHRVLDPGSVRESVEYLTDTYGVSKQEALRRLQLQDDATRLDEALSRDAGATYGGMWLDHAAGGVLVVAMTRPADADKYLKAVPDRENVRTKAVRYSLADLNAARDRIATKVGAGSDAVYLPAVSESDNQVVVWERGWVAAEKQGRVGAAAVEADSARSAVAAEPAGLVATRTLVKPEPMATPNVDWGFCHPLYCTNHGPMRGGLRLDMQRDAQPGQTPTWGGCTAGFNLRSTGGGFPGVPWVLTAGHCMATKTNNTPTQHNGTSVLRQHGIEKNSYPYDYAALQYVDTATATTWLGSHTGRNRVLKYCRNGGADSNADTPCGEQATTADEFITGTHALAEIKAGWVVCATGSGSNVVNYPASHDSGAGTGYLVGTRCGRVLSTDVGINTDLCARPGDSGGPLFSQVDHTALGILEGSQQSRGGACWAGELNNYVPIETIITDLNQRIAGQGTVFSVITTPNG